mgnify:CR=1 FL=1
MTRAPLRAYDAEVAICSDDVEGLYDMENHSVYLAADVDALLRQREEEVERLKDDVKEFADEIFNLQEQCTSLLKDIPEGGSPSIIIADLRAQLAVMTDERDVLLRERNSWPVLRLEGSDAQVVLLQQQLAARERAVWLEAAKMIGESIGADDDIWYMGTVRKKRVNQLLVERANQCRQQAEAVKP